MIKIRAEYCPQNHRCPVIRHCPTGAITQKDFGPPEIDDSKCTLCCKCTQKCSVFMPVGCCEKGPDSRRW